MNIKNRNLDIIRSIERIGEISMAQLELPFDEEWKEDTNSKNVVRYSFSHDSVASETARIELEDRYKHLLVETDRFDRKTVSFQANKQTLLHSWIKYREGFSAELVRRLIDEFGLTTGQAILEPFSGSATTLLVAKTHGISATGCEILPVCHLSWKAKSRVYDYSIEELRSIYSIIQELEYPDTNIKFPHIAITDTAFSDDTENHLMYLTQWVDESEISENAKILLKLLLTSVLESISFTQKDGQFLRWDQRSGKLRRRNEKRERDGKKLVKGIHKGDLPTVKNALLDALSVVIADIEELQTRVLEKIEGSQVLIEGSTLSELPKLDPEQFDAVITSPPYCNRYDYTRTYALELAYLGIGETEIRDLRHTQLSCTVENKSKIEELRDIYKNLDREKDFDRILSVVHGNPVFCEVNNALKIRSEMGEVNNAGVLNMVEGYFTELCFVFAEMYRTCKPGAHIAIVNDNVRYSGEIIPVDLLSTDIASSLGFEPVKVYVLKQRKGNSSQQMQRYGREALRKSITIWKKPLENV